VLKTFLYPILNNSPRTHVNAKSPTKTKYHQDKLIPLWFPTIILKPRLFNELSSPINKNGTVAKPSKPNVTFLEGLDWIKETLSVRYTKIIKYELMLILRKKLFETVVG
jgi:hypothetical protein